MAANKNKSIPIIFYICLGALALFTLLDVVSDFNVNYRYQQTQCRILDHKLKKYPKGKFGLLIELEFAANNQQYRVAALPSRMYKRITTGPTAQQFVVAYPIGSEVPCWYYSGNPAGTVVLEQGYHIGSIMVWLGCILIAVFYLSSLYLTKISNTRPRGMVDSSGLFRVHKTLLTLEYYYIGDKPVTKDMLPADFSVGDLTVFDSMVVNVMNSFYKEFGQTVRQARDELADKLLRQLKDKGVIVAIKPSVKRLCYPVIYVSFCMIMYGSVANMILLSR